MADGFLVKQFAGGTQSPDDHPLSSWELVSGSRGRATVLSFIAYNATAGTPGQAAQLILRVFGATIGSDAGPFSTSGDLGCSGLIVVDWDAGTWSSTSGHSGSIDAAGIYAMRAYVNLISVGSAVGSEGTCDILSTDLDDFDETLDQPDAPTVTDNGDGTVTVEWTDPGDPNETIVLQNGTQVFFTPTNTVTLPTPTESTTYQVVTINGTNSSPPSPPSSPPVGGGCIGGELDWVVTATPNTGPLSGGTTITVDGVDTTGADLRVSVDGKRAIATVIDSNTITFELPAGDSQGIKDLQVHRLDDGSYTAPIDFTYTYDRPTITNVVTVSGPVTGGTVVRIEGFNFVAGSQVYFGDTPATSVNYIDSETIEAVSPPHIVGTVDILVLEP